jgi:hypothetical protein
MTYAIYAGGIVAAVWALARLAVWAQEERR